MNQLNFEKIDLVINNITDSIHFFREEKLLQNASYDYGLLGYSLYYSFLSKYKNEIQYISIAEDFFNKAIECLDFKDFKKIHSTDSVDLRLSNIGRFVEFATRNKLLNISAQDYLIKLDDILFDLMKSKISIKDFDSGSGALACGYYFLCRIKNGAKVEEQLAFLVQAIYKSALKDRDGDYFWQSPSLYNRIYLGISHGSSLIISFLCTTYEHNVEEELCKKIITKASSFLTKQFRISPFKGLFPNMIGDKVEPMQFALCYGDIGVGYALFRAANLLSDPKLKTLSEFVLEDCLNRTKEDNLTLDAGIYYGASGVAIAFSKIAHLTSDKRFEHRADYWYSTIPLFSIHNNEFAGFQTRLLKNAESWNLWNISFGWGIIGIGISAMKYVNKNLPSIEELTFIA